MPVAAWVLALVVTFLAAAVQGVVGMGFALVSVPILVLVDPALAPVPQLLVTLPLTLQMVWRERTHVQLAGVGWVVAGRIPGALIGVALLAVATQRTLEIAIAVTVLVAASIIAFGFHLQRSPATEFGAGMLSGVTGLVASIGGPPLALLFTRDEAPTIRSNLAAIFSIGLTITIAARVLSGNISMEDVRIALVLLPALMAGYLFSLRFKDRVSQSTVRNGIVALAVVGAIALLAKAFV